MKRKLFHENKRSVSPLEDNGVNKEIEYILPSEEARKEHANVIGEDMDTLEMSIEDCIQQLSCDNSEYPHSYLLDCWKKLMSKVDDYRKRLEEAYTANSELVRKHRKELETVRSFYQSIIHLPTRAGRILKASHGKTSAARQLLGSIMSLMERSILLCTK